MTRTVGRWIDVQKIETGYINNETDTYIVVTFKRSDDYIEAFEESVNKASRMRQRRLVI